MNPDAAIANEEFEGDDSSVKNWKGGTTDFSFIDEEPPPPNKIWMYQNLKKSSQIDFSLNANQKILTTNH